MIGLVLTATGGLMGASALLLSQRAPVASRCLLLQRPAKRTAATRPLPAFVEKRTHAANISDRHARNGLTLIRLVVVASGCLVAVGHLGAGAAVAAAAVGAPWALVTAWRHRRDDHLLAALPPALESVSRSLRSGSSLLGALDEATAGQRGPLSEAFARIVVGTNRGEPLEQALERFAALSKSSELRVAATALAMAADSGAGPARVLDGVSDSLRDRERVRKEIAALTSQARSSAGVLIVLPIAFVALNALIDPGALIFLFGDSFGRLCLAGGLALDLVGWLWMRRLIAQVRA